MLIIRKPWGQIQIEEYSAKIGLKVWRTILNKSRTTRTTKGITLYWLLYWRGAVIKGVIEIIGEIEYVNYGIPSVLNVLGVYRTR